MRHAIVAAGIVLGLGAAGPAAAEGYPPFYGYSTYFGGPSTYFTDDTDVQQATTIKDSDLGFGTRTYYRGGPFWTYEPTQKRLRTQRSRRTVLRSKG